MKMWQYIVRRVLLVIPVVIGVMTITFVLVSALPTQTRILSYEGPSKFGTGPTASCAKLGLPPPAPGVTQCPNPWWTHGIHALGLNQPIPLQWARYVANSFSLNWGYTAAFSVASEQLSIGDGTPVAQVLSWYIPYTLELAAISLLFILLFSIPLGNMSAVLRNRPFDQAVRVFSFSGWAIPTFLLSVLTLLALTAAFGGYTAICNGSSTPYQLWWGSWPSWSCPPFNGPPYNGVQPSWIGPNFQTYPTHFPTVDALYHGEWFLAWETIRRMIVPALTIAFTSIAGVLRFVRNSMLEVMNLEYVRTARAIGVSEGRVIHHHAGRNSLIVTITVLGLTFAFFIGGFPITELVWHLNGIGLVLAYSILSPADFGLIFGTTLVFTLIVVAANIIVDVLYAYLDPRVRLG